MTAALPDAVLSHWTAAACLGLPVDSLGRRAPASCCTKRASSSCGARSRCTTSSAAGWRGSTSVTGERRWACSTTASSHFDGEAERWQRDIDRDELARAAGWEIVVLTALNLRDPQRMIAKVAAAYARAAARR